EPGVLRPVHRCRLDPGLPAQDRVLGGLRLGRWGAGEHVHGHPQPRHAGRLPGPGRRGRGGGAALRPGAGLGGLAVRDGRGQRRGRLHRAVGAVQRRPGAGDRHPVRPGHPVRVHRAVRREVAERGDADRGGLRAHHDDDAELVRERGDRGLPHRPGGHRRGDLHPGRGPVHPGSRAGSARPGPRRPRLTAPPSVRQRSPPRPEMFQTSRRRAFGTLGWRSRCAHPGYGATTPVTLGMRPTVRLGSEGLTVTTHSLDGGRRPVPASLLQGLLYTVAGVTIAVALGFAAVDRFLLSAAVCFAGMLPTALLTFALRGRSPRYEGVERLQRQRQMGYRSLLAGIALAIAGGILALVAPSGLATLFLWMGPGTALGGGFAYHRARAELAQREN